MLRYVRYSVIAMSVVFLLATSVTAAMAPHTPTYTPMQRSNTHPPSSGPANDGADLAPHLIPTSSEGGSKQPIISEPVVPSLSAPLGTLPTAVPPDPATAPRELNPRQNPTTK